MSLPFPWNDHAGRFAPVKAATLVLLCAPAAWTAFDFVADNLGARPINQAIREIGHWAVRFLLVALAITPARQIFRWTVLASLRRMIGVSVFCYIAAHLVLFTAQEMWAIVHVATEIVLRLYLTIGFVALIGLAALAATSTDGAVRRMGGKAWQRLHRTVYVIALLGLIHYFLQSKLDVYQPTLMAGLFLWLMAWRALDWAGLRPGRAPVLWTFVLGIGAGALTLVCEAAYFSLFMHVDLMLIVEAALTFDSGVRPGWYVLAIGMAVFLAASARAPFARPVKARARAA